MKNTLITSLGLSYIVLASCTDFPQEEFTDDDDTTVTDIIANDDDTVVDDEGLPYAHARCPPQDEMMYIPNFGGYCVARWPAHVNEDGEAYHSPDIEGTSGLSWLEAAEACDRREDSWSLVPSVFWSAGCELTPENFTGKNEYVDMCDDFSCPLYGIDDCFTPTEYEDQDIDVFWRCSAKLLDEGYSQ